VPAFSCFTEGAKSSFKIVADVFPYLVAIFIAIELLNASGATGYIITFVAPAFKVLGIPAEVAKLVLLRPFSGSGSLVILDEIFAVHGPDSYAGRCASVIMGSSDTVFYIAGVYFAVTKVKRLRFAIPVALTATIFSAQIACLLCRVF
jgi:spore maturation protein B